MKRLVGAVLILGVIGGLTTSLLITLVLVPTVYTLFEEGLGAFRRGTKPAAGAAH